MPVNVWQVDPPSVCIIEKGFARPFIKSGALPPRVFKVGVRFMVRGHWRNQACGPGNTQRKTIWVQPHLKGPDDAIAQAKVYKVTNAKS